MPRYIKLRGQQILMVLERVEDLNTLVRRYWEIGEHEPTGRFKRGDQAHVLKMTDTTSLLIVVRPGVGVILNETLYLDGPDDWNAAGWCYMRGKIGLNTSVFVFRGRDKYKTDRDGQSKLTSTVHIEIFDEKGSHQDHIPSKRGRIEEVIGDPPEDGEIRVLQDDEGSGEEPIP